MDCGTTVDNLPSGAPPVPPSRNDSEERKLGEKDECPSCHQRIPKPDTRTDAERKLDALIAHAIREGAYHKDAERMDCMRRYGEIVKKELRSQAAKIERMEKALTKIREWHTEGHSRPKQYTVYFTADEALSSL